ncbi:relaxase/mobilization nuclease domain-containing protein [Lactococcus lactis]|uniref:relaxase/mobilization nuclease domain-containing protein n=1 Tax=Lactococcus lactis TaxID=1358 RepID=UPI00129372EA|nr:relaxase/mobilization nuclease domain-containing protein [Lactococcus lactis]MQQ79381.1 relaxase/mobilization nuclease domain-containing protein [Lactococcus lactis]
MSVVKIQTIRNLTRAVKYVTQDYKIEHRYITTNDCFENSIKSDFDYVTNEYNRASNRSIETKSRMIIQSFSKEDNLNAEQAHQLGVELAEKYLGKGHQFMVVTHEETDHFHNHIIFNSVNQQTMKMFDSKRKHTIDDLRQENDLISVKHGLKIPEVTNEKGYTLNEYISRSKGNSVKAKLENIIDETIEKSSNFEEFCRKIEEQGISIKKGKYFSLTINSRTFRTKTLGINYLENSIKYRIDNKDFIPLKKNFLEKEWFDKDNEKFINNIGLRKWATKKNIEYLSELSSKIYNDKNFLSKTDDERLNFYQSYFTKDIQKLDNSIVDLEQKKECFAIYRDSHSFILDYKSAENKTEFKKQHYKEFLQYDLAKKNIYILKEKYNIRSEAELKERINSLNKERNELYSILNKNKKRNLDIEI